MYDNDVNTKVNTMITKGNIKYTHDNSFWSGRVP